MEALQPKLKSMHKVREVHSVYHTRKSRMFINTFKWAQATVTGLAEWFIVCMAAEVQWAYMELEL